MKRKYRIESFLLFEYEAVERHLKAMAAKGWLLEEVDGFIWKYIKAEPQKMKYSVTYIPNADDLNSEETRQEKMLSEYCEEAGWKKVGKWNEMQIFATHDDTTLPIDTDEKLRLKIIRSSMMKHFLPIYILFAGWVLIKFLLNLNHCMTQPVQFLSQQRMMFTTGALAVILACLGGILGSYLHWSHQSAKNIQMGGGCVNTTKHGIYIAIKTILVCVTIASVIHVWIVAVFFLTILMIVRKIQKLLLQKGFNKHVNSFVAICLIYILMIGCWYMLDNVAYLNEKIVQEDALVQAERKDFRFTIEELQNTNRGAYSFKREEHESVFVKWGQYWQVPKSDDADEALIYEVVTVKQPALYEWCRKQYLEKKEGSYQKVQLEGGSDWEIYCYHTGEKLTRNWLILKEDTIIEISTTWELTEGALKGVLEKF